MDHKSESSVEHPTISELRKATAFYALLFFPACFLASQAGYIFDGGESSEKLTLFWIIVGLPINIVVSVACAWAFHGAKRFSQAAVMLSLPFIHFIITVLAMF